MSDPRHAGSAAHLKAFGAWIRLLRQARKLSQDDLATRAGIDRVIIGRIERGEVNFGFAYLWPLAGAFGVEVKDLFPTKPDPLLIPRGDATGNPPPR